MLTRSFVDFLRDERGSYTLWSLVWFLLYVAMGGLAVDITDAYRYHTQLQATADAAALAGVMSVGTTQDPVQVALEYARVNMSPNIHGPVLKAADVQVGEWHFATETFFPNSTNPNAVYVTTRRDAENDNQVVMSFLRILQGFGLRPSWDIVAEAVAVVGVDVCDNEGFIAGTKLDFRTWTNFQNGLCLIGHEGFNLAGQGASQSTFDDTVYIGVGCEADQRNCIGHGTNPWNNDDFVDAFDSEGPGTGNYEDSTTPRSAELVDEYINHVLSLANPPAGDSMYSSFDTFVATMRESGLDFSGWSYLVAEGASRPGYQQINTETDPIPETFESHTVYEVNCPSSGFELPPRDYSNVAFIADCPITFRGTDSTTFTLTNSLIATTYSSGSRMSVHAGPDINWGTTCEDGIELYSLGDVDFAADATIIGSRMLVQGDVHFAASPDGPAGIHIEATGEIFQASGAYPGTTWGLCGDYVKNGPVILSYSLMR